MQLVFDIKDTESNILEDFIVIIDGTEVEMLADKKTTKNAFTYKTKLNYVVKKSGFVDSTKVAYVVGADEPNKMDVQLVSLT